MRRERLLSWLILCLAALAGAGCLGRDAAPPEPEPEDVSLDGALQFRMNAKAEVNLAGRWRNVYSERAVLDRYVRKLAEHYLATFQEHGISLPSCRGPEGVTYTFPTEVVVEIDPKVKVGAISSFRRLLRSHGFTNVRIAVPEGAEVPPEEPGGN